MTEQMLQEVSRMQTRLTDLVDMLQDGAPAGVEGRIREEIVMLQDQIFYANQMDDEQFGG